MNKPDSDHLREVGALLSAAVLVQRHLPRGKGAASRWLGKWFLAPDSSYMTTRHGSKLVMSPMSIDCTLWARCLNPSDIPSKASKNSDTSSRNEKPETRSRTRKTW